jgi:hypothetical protein
VATELLQTKAGILCVTADNIEAPWLNFEAGALSKTVGRTLVSPYLIGVKPSDLKGPLVQFQATESSKSDTRRLIGTLNKALDEAALSEKQLDKAFGAFWPGLESALTEIQSVKIPQRPQRSEREMLEEILALVREQTKRDPAEAIGSRFRQWLRERESQPTDLTRIWSLLDQHRGENPSGPLAGLAGRTVSLQDLMTPTPREASGVEKPELEPKGKRPGVKKKKSD